MSAPRKTSAPKGRNVKAQGQEPSPAGRSHESQSTSSPEVVKDAGTLPPGWSRSTLGKTCDILAGFGFPERLQGKTEGEIAFFKVGDISEAWKRSDVYLSKANHYISRTEAASIRATPLPQDTTVFAKIGAAIALNRRAILSKPALVDNNVMGLHPASGGLDAKYLFHFACTLKLDDLSRATTVPSIRKSDIESIPIPVAPLPEQRRIVAEIEKQFTRLDAGVASLRRVQANLKRYRAAVLKAACEGKLVPTEAELAKKEGRSFESGETLLQRILTERRNKWTGRGKYNAPAAPDTTNLPQLPEGWAWTHVEQLLTEPLCNGISIKGSDEPPGVRALRLSAMSDSGFDYSDVRYLPLTELDVSDLWIQEGDFYMSRGNGSLHLVGRGTSAQKPPNLTIFPDTMIRLRLADAVLKSGWVRTLWPSCIIRSQIEAKVKTTAGIYKIAQPQVERMAIPLPPFAEQTRIVAEVERRLSVVEELEAVVSANLQRATRLRQSILQKAFSGELIS